MTDFVFAEMDALVPLFYRKLGLEESNAAKVTQPVNGRMGTLDGCKSCTLTQHIYLLSTRQTGPAELRPKPGLFNKFYIKVLKPEVCDS